MQSEPFDYERVVQEVYEAVLREGHTALDIGAHRGRHTLPLARCVGPTGKVYAVEPLPACRDDLRRQLDQDPAGLVARIHLLPFALSDHAGPASFVVAESHLDFSGLREVPYPGPTATSTFAVELETIDRLFYDLESLDYLKLDAEGAELEILEGGTACLKKFRPAVGFEFGTYANRAYGVRPADMARFWAAHDYEILAITGAALDEAAFVRCAERRDIWDYVAVPAEAAALVRRVRQVLQRPRVNWLAVRAQLNHADAHANVGATVPPLRRLRGPLWPLARAGAALFLLAARMITIPQRLFNRATLLAWQKLLADLETSECHGRQQDRRIHDLEQRLATLEAEFRLDKAKLERNGGWIDMLEEEDSDATGGELPPLRERIARPKRFDDE